MDGQLPLLADPALRLAERRLYLMIERDEPERIELVSAFLAFHQQNPRVYQLLERFTAEKLTRRDRFGIRQVWERMRWEIPLETADTTDFKLNDHYPPYYARLLMLHHETWEGVFETRTSARHRGRREAA